MCYGMQRHRANGKMVQHRYLLGRGLFVYSHFRFGKEDRMPTLSEIAIEASEAKQDEGYVKGPCI
jgi:hypothetical protein